MQDNNRSFVDRQFLRSLWDLDFQAFKDSEEEKALNERLRRWSERADLGENSAISAFFEQFFEKTWGYVQSGQSGSEEGTSKNVAIWPDLGRISLVGSVTGRS